MNSCKFEGCDEPRRGRGYCSAHYAQLLRRDGDESELIPLKLVKYDPVCVFPGCGLPHSSRGYCHTHYAQLRYKNGDVSLLKPIRGGGTVPTNCSFDTCDRKAVSLGLCDSHWRMQSKGEPLRTIRSVHRVRDGETCIVPTCETRPQMRGVCRKHVKLKSTYQLSDERIIELFTNPSCVGCDRTDQLHVDHDHSCCPGAGSCGECVRGLLCNGCNTALGLVRDSTTTLERLIRYLGAS